MDLRSILRSLLKHWWIVVLSTVVAAGVGVALTATTAPQYSSSVTFFVRTPAEQIGGAYQGDQFAQKRVNSYVQLAESQRLAQLVRDDTQLSLSPAEISSKIRATADQNTVLLTVTVTDTDPQRSLDLAQSVANEFVTLVAGLETPPGSSTPTVTLDVTSDATLNPVPVSPRPTVNIGLAALAGLLVGLILAVMKDMLDTSIRGVDVLKQLTGRAVMACVPFDDTVESSPLIVESHAQSPRAEAFRQLRTNLGFYDVDRPLKVLAVTSSIPSEGKSSTATNLAVAFAEAGRKVLLVDADLRRPRVANYLGLEGSIGLTDVLTGRFQVDDVLQPWGKGGLSVLPCGSVPPNPSELLDSQSMRDLISSLKQTFDVIIMDTPPLLPVTDAAIVASRADGALLVTRYAKTTKAQLKTAVSNLDAVDARLVGTILNMVPKRERDSYAYGYGEYRASSDTVDKVPLEAAGSVESEPEQSLEPTNR